MTEALVTPRNLLIQNFILDLEKAFSDKITTGQDYYVDLLTEKIYVREGENIFRVTINWAVFLNLTDFQKAFDELVSEKEIIGFLVGGIHFLPERNSEGKRILKFRKNKNFLTEETWRNRKINYFLLEK